jgi:hypothetical protein
VAGFGQSLHPGTTSSASSQMASTVRPSALAKERDQTPFAQRSRPDKKLNLKLQPAHRDPYIRHGMCGSANRIQGTQVGTLLPED